MKTVAGVVVATATATLLWAAPAAAQSLTESRPALPADKICPMPLAEVAPRDWLAQERWAWDERICLGKIADLSQRPGALAGGCDVGTGESWPPDRRLTSRFVRTVLFHEPFQSSYTQQGLALRCASFEEILDISEGEFDRGIVIERSFLARGVDATGLHVRRELSLAGSRLKDTFHGNGLRVDGSLLLRDGGKYRKLFLRGAVIDGDVDGNNSDFFGDSYAERARIAGSLLLSGETLRRGINLRGARIEGSLEVEDANLLGMFDADNVRVQGDVFFRGTKAKREIRLVGAQVFGNLETDGAALNGGLRVDRLRAGGHVFLRYASILWGSLIGAEIGGNLDLRGSRFDGLFDVTGATVRGDLLLGDSDEVAIWSDNAQLVMRNLSVGAIQDQEAAWRNLDGRLDLSGFSYVRLGGLAGTAGSTIDYRTPEELVAWLHKQGSGDGTFNPQPYEQLASVLRRHGHVAKADAVMVAAQNRMRDSTNDVLLSALLWAEWATIGYGYETWRSVLALGALLLFGAWVAGRDTSAIGQAGYWRRFWYSFDQLIPVFQIDEAHSRVELGGWRLHYFYLHRILGFVLASFFVAGLTGLTK